MLFARGRRCMSVSERILFMRLDEALCPLLGFWNAVLMRLLSVVSCTSCLLSVDSSWLGFIIT